MGKYMKKSKITSDVVAVMEVTSGVRTRAKTHALQLLQSPVSSNQDATSTCYLQLRSRRLEKPAPLFNAETKRNPTREKDSFNCKGASRLRVNSSRTTGDCDGKGTEKLGFKCETEDFESLKEASSGDNCFRFRKRGRLFTQKRCTRESTPCSLIRDPETIATPGSTTRQRSSTSGSQRLLNTQRNVPTTCEMDEFFAAVEQQQQRLFIEKYNFDIVNDLPLSGHYDWVRVIP
ncbi:CYCLIN-DEPENDENT KINASE INHIBITOR 4-RELATED [Salix viminalis]|uniref:CYCLIN-DEPENDENT KINASE INHIBITOR 4-RELATED n=1 Tax=Salix viminalis TaxID=40686 RepID=A0A9Q0UFL7_SALVM|nr:CYCLIN-DEPENDENT KINASE INHIBITOR 4-RELATED [Salix viminalis]